MSFPSQTASHLSRKPKVETAMRLATYNTTPRKTRRAFPCGPHPISPVSGIADFLHTFYRPLPVCCCCPQAKGIPFPFHRVRRRRISSFDASSSSTMRRSKFHPTSPGPVTRITTITIIICEGMLENDEECQTERKKTKSLEGRVAKKGSSSVSNLSNPGNMKNIPNMYTQILAPTLRCAF